MEITFRGANCTVINNGKDTAVVDPKLQHIGKKDVVVKNAIQLLTDPQFRVEGEQRLYLDSPGEFEVGNFSIRGIAAKRSIDDDDQKRSTIYSLEANNIRVVILGHVASSLSEEQYEQIGDADVVIIPIGGHGYTLDTQAATSIVRHIDPKVVIPTHYQDDMLAYEVPQASIEDFAKALGAPRETVGKLKLKTSSLPGTLTLFELTRV